MCPSVTVHLVGGIRDEVQHDILDESFVGPLEHPEYGTSINNHSVSGNSWGLVTSTWSLRLRMDFDFEILSSPLFSSKMEVGTGASSCFNTSFRLIAIVLVNAVTLANINTAPLDPLLAASCLPSW